MEQASESGADERRVLIVDDSRREILATILTLRECGFLPVHVIDGTFAIEAVRGAEYCCILVDLQMAAMGGEALIDYWSMEAPELLSRIILITGFPDKGRNLESRVCGILVKPYKRRELEASVRRCIEGGVNERADRIRRAEQIPSGQ
jgi:DNA-binding NtrC family response regulator